MLVIQPSLHFFDRSGDKADKFREHNAGAGWGQHVAELSLDDLDSGEVLDLNFGTDDPRWVLAPDAVAVVGAYVRAEERARR